MHQEYWDAVEEILKKATGKEDVSGGLAALKSRWQNSKGWMEPFFDSRGFRVMTVTKELQLKYGMIDIWLEARRIAHLLTTTNVKYCNIPVLRSDGGCAIVSFLQSCVKGPRLSAVNILGSDAISPLEFANNELEDSRSYPDRPGKTLQAGTKVSTYLKAILESDAVWDNNGLYLGPFKPHRETITQLVLDVYSQAISYARVADIEVVLSINPIDYLFISYHTTGYTSCQSIFNGCYKTGPIAYLVDDKSAVSYAYREIEPVENLSFKWPRKMWRCMVYFDSENQSALHVREYPGRAPALAAASRFLSSGFLAEYYKQPHEFSFQGCDWSIESVPGETRSSAQISYSKVGSWFYGDPVSYGVRLNNGSYPNHLAVGSTTIPCVVCGGERTGPSDLDLGTNYIFCRVCDPRVACVHCHAKYPLSEIKVSPTNGRRYCKSCYAHLYHTCIVCGKEVSVYSSKRTADGWTCRRCYPDNFAICSDCGRPIRITKLLVTFNGALHCSVCYIGRHYGEPYKNYQDITTEELAQMREDSKKFTNVVV